MVILLRDVMSSLASRCDSYSADSTTEIVARLSANLRINEFFKRRILWRKKARNLLKRCPEKQSNIVKALTGSYSLKRRKAIEKPKFPDPSNCFFFFHGLQGCKEQYFFRNTSFPKENWNNLIPRKRRAASLISKPPTKNQY